MRTRRGFALAILLTAGIFTAQAGVNSPVTVDAGEVVKGDQSTVNGRIRVGDGATVHGDLSSVNGPIRVGRDVRAESLSAVNGSIEVEPGSVIDDEVETVNGPITLHGTEAGKVSTINGPIELRGATVRRDVRTINGDITLADGSRVDGNIVIEEANRNSNHRRDPLRITIGSDSVVGGDILVEDDDLEVEVHVRGGGVIRGRVEGARLFED